MRIRVMLGGVCALAMGCALASATTYVVTPDGTGNFPTIQAAIDAADNGDIIELTDGTFRGDGNRDVDCLGKALTVRSQSGNPESCVLDCEASASDYHRGFIFQSGEGAGTVLQGITIRNGYCPRGGGLLCIAASPRVVACIVERNAALDNGGGVDCQDGSAASFESCTIAQNWSESNGGGGVCYGCRPTFTRCVFSQNQSGYEGGGLACYTGGNPVLSQCVFSGNSTYAWGVGGGALLCSVGAPTVSECSFVENATIGEYGFGGGVCASFSEGAEFSGCIFAGNAASEQGGAVRAFMSVLTFHGCTFSGNSAEGGGGGVCTYRSNASLNGCTLYANSAVTGSGVLCRVGGQVVLDRVIVAFGVAGEAIRCEDATTAALSCCDLYGNEGGDWVGAISDQYGTNGNISADPLFCNAGIEDFTLHADSACAPDSNPDCGLIGAWPVACSATPVEGTTWGGIKAMFRR
jgi:hypothetical protein